MLPLNTADMYLGLGEVVDERLLPWRTLQASQAAAADGEGHVRVLGAAQGPGTHLLSYDSVVQIVSYKNCN